MNGSAFVYPGTFPANTPSLGTVDLSYVPRIEGASHHWSSRQLEAGPISDWVDRVSGVSLSTAAGGNAPQVYAGLRKVVRFNAPDRHRLSALVDLNGPKTFIIVAGFKELKANQMLTYGYDTSTFWNFYQGSNGKFAFSGGKTLSSGKENDTGRHVFMITYNGASSVFNIDGVDYPGDAGMTPSRGFRLGANATEYFSFDVETIAILPFAASEGRRKTLVDQMRYNHGFTIKGV